MSKAAGFWAWLTETGTGKMSMDVPYYVSPEFGGGGIGGIISPTEILGGGGAVGNDEPIIINAFDPLPPIIKDTPTPTVITSVNDIPVVTDNLTPSAILKNFITERPLITAAIIGGIAYVVLGKKGK